MLLNSIQQHFIFNINKRKIIVKSLYQLVQSQINEELSEEDKSKYASLAKKEKIKFDKSRPAEVPDPGDDASEEEKKRYEENKKAIEEWEKEKEEADKQNKEIDDAIEALKKEYGAEWEEKIKDIKTDETDDKQDDSKQEDDKQDIETQLKELHGQLEDNFKNSDAYKNAEDKDAAMKEFQDKLTQMDAAVRSSNSLDIPIVNDIKKSTNTQPEEEIGKQEDDSKQEIDKQEDEAPKKKKANDDDPEQNLKDKKDELQKVKNEIKEKNKAKRQEATDKLFMDDKFGLTNVPIVGLFASLVYLGIMAKRTIEAQGDSESDKDKIKKAKEEYKLAKQALKCVSKEDDNKEHAEVIKSIIQKDEIPSLEANSPLMIEGAKQAKEGIVDKLKNLLSSKKNEIEEEAKAIESDVKSEVETDEKIEKAESDINIAHAESEADAAKAENDKQDDSSKEEKNDDETKKNEPEKQDDNQDKETEKFEIEDDGVKKHYIFSKGPQGGNYVVVVRNGVKGNKYGVSEEEKHKMIQSLKQGKAPAEKQHESLRYYVLMNIIDD